ncbi:MAG: hypothetical protein Q8873_04465 [Bacillota bacterium]|nr:hypothetical protein [Bacillota bacterium]
MIKKLFIIIGIIFATLFAVALIYGFVIWFSFGGGIYFLPNPPKPAITYGEFPFKLTYELDGETKTITDVAICEFDGYGQRTEAGQSRKWKTHLKSGTDELIPANERGTETDFAWITMLDLRKDGAFDDFGHKVLELYFYGGNGHYYMGDELGGNSRAGQDFTWVDYMYQNADGTIGHSGYKANEAWEKYKIRLISWEPSSPIKNSFK